MSDRRIIETHSEYFIKKILAIDDTYTKVAYDNSPPLEEFKPSGVWFILVSGTVITGFINLQLITNVMWNAHIFIFPDYRGSGSEEWGNQVAQYMKEHYKAERFLAITPYESARRYAERMGFKYVTTLLNSIQKNGQLMHQHLLEM